MYLLDTHVFLWWLKADKKLGKPVLSIISNQSNIIFVSSATIWEIAIKAKLGKIKVPSNIEDFISKSGFEELSINVSHASHTKRLPLYHKDPFDRMLIAQAMLENLTILTHDKIFKKYKVDVQLA